MQRRDINAADAPAPAGQYSQAVEVTGTTRTLYVSGQVGVASDGSIPENAEAWDVTVRSAAKLATTLRDDFEHALLFKTLAQLRIDRSLLPSVESLRWTGPTDGFTVICRDLDAIPLAKRVLALAAARA